MDEATLHARRWYGLAVLCVTLLVITLDNTILNVALPALVDDLGASTSQLQWIVDGYTLVFAGLLLTMGSLGDRFGRRGALLGGVAIFVLGSVASAFAGSANHLIITRASMGIGAALIMPSTLSLLTDIFPDPRERGRAIGIWVAVSGAGGAIGPVIGGLLLKHFSWGSIFFVNVPVGIIAIVAGWFLLPSSRDKSAPRLDIIGASLSTLGLVAVLWAIIEGPSRGWTDGMTVAGIAVGIALLVVFVLWELHTTHPMLDVRFFEDRRFSAANFALTLVFFAMFGVMFLATQYLQSVLGYTPLEAGVRFLPMAVVMVLVAPNAPRVVERVGTKVVVGGGLLLVSIGLATLSTVPVADGYSRLLLGFFFVACGMGLTMAPATESIMGSLPRAKAGVGSAMNDTTRQMGGALGVAVLGSVFATNYRPGLARRLADSGLSSDQLAHAQDSVGGALRLAAGLPGELAETLTRAAKLEFLHGMHDATRVAAGVILVAAIVVFVFLPAHAASSSDEPESALEALASVSFAEAEVALAAARHELAEPGRTANSTGST